MRRHAVFQSGRWRFSKSLSVLFCGAVAACGGHGDDRVKSPIVALVNDRPITVAQLNQVTHSADSVAPAQAIESLVNEELLVQGAERQQMAFDPAVAQAIAASRRQILAHAFAERNLYTKSEVSTMEAQEFYRANPILFEKRKRFWLKDYSFEGAKLDGQLTAALENVHTDTDLRALLDSNKIAFSVQPDSISADQLPLDKLSDFEHASVGDVMTARQSQSKAMVMLITDVQDDAPLSFERARPYIETYLSNMHNQQALSTYLEQAKKDAKIIYAEDLKERAAKTDQGKQ